MQSDPFHMAIRVKLPIVNEIGNTFTTPNILLASICFCRRRQRHHRHNHHHFICRQLCAMHSLYLIAHIAQITQMLSITWHRRRRRRRRR